MAVIEFSFAPDHPASEGHFPGNPVIPGAVLLNAALEAIEQSLSLKVVPCTVKSAKFLSPVRPGDKVSVEYVRVEAGELRFKAAVNGKAVLAGHVQCESRPDAT